MSSYKYQIKATHQSVQEILSIKEFSKLNCSKQILSACLFHKWLSRCKKSKYDTNPFQRYWGSNNTRIWLAKSIFDHNLQTGIFLDVVFAEPQKWTTRNKRTTKTFISDHFQTKLMSSFSFKVQKPYCRAIFDLLRIFPKIWIYIKICAVSLLSP